MHFSATCTLGLLKSSNRREASYTQHDEDNEKAHKAHKKRLETAPDEMCHLQTDEQVVLRNTVVQHHFRVVA